MQHFISLWKVTCRTQWYHTWKSITIYGPSCQDTVTQTHKYVLMVHKTTHKMTPVAEFFRVMRSLLVPLLQEFCPVWRCSEGRVGQGDHTSQRVASFMSKRTWETYEAAFITPCARQESCSTSLQGIGETRLRVALQTYYQYHHQTIHTNYWVTGW